MAAVDSIAQTIQRIEGYFPPGTQGYPTGSVSYRDNNPGNLKFANQTGAIGADSQGFAIFPDYNTGYSELQKQINLDSSRGLTLSQFISKYAPVNENNTSSYLSELSASTGIQPNDPLLGADTTSSAASVLSGSITDWFSSLSNDIPSVISDPSSVSTETWIILSVGVVASVLLLRNAL